MAKSTMGKHKRIIISSIVMVFLLVSFLVGTLNFEAGSTQILENAFFTDTIYTSSSGQVKEAILVNYSNIPNLTEVQKADLISLTNTLFDSNKTALLNEYSNKLSLETQEIKDEYSGKVSIAVETQEDNVIFQINFETQAVWEYFTSISGYSYTPITTQQFFTYTKYDRQEMIGAVSTLSGAEGYFANYLKIETYSLVDDYDDTLLPTVEIVSAYTYVTPYRRRHSNANEIAKVNTVYYHQWNTTNISDIIFFTTIAKVEVWYIISLAAAFLIVGVILTISFVKNARKKEEPTLKITIGTNSQGQPEIKDIKPIKQSLEEKAKQDLEEK